jgi:hypothetical protein
MASQMLNFRAKDQFVAVLDNAARLAGMNRSDFIRAALEKAVEGSGNGSTTTAPPQPKARKKTCPPHPQEQLLETQYGVKICKLCGGRVASSPSR